MCRAVRANECAEGREGDVDAWDSCVGCGTYTRVESTAWTIIIDVKSKVLSVPHIACADSCDSGATNAHHQSAVDRT